MDKEYEELSDRLRKIMTSDPPGTGSKEYIDTLWGSIQAFYDEYYSHEENRNLWKGLADE